MDGNGPRKTKIIGVILFGFSIVYLVSSLRIDVGTPRNPGPGFFPIAIGFLLTAFTGVYLALVIRKRTPRDKAAHSVEDKNYRAIAVIIAAGIVYPLILGTLKFLVSTFAATFLMLYILKPQKLFNSIFLALAMAIVSFMVFSRLLGVGLPMGPLEVLMFNIGG
jgi:uncharacterized membrane protein YidH (DUF202 family)